LAASEARGEIELDQNLAGGKPAEHDVAFQRVEDVD
jgi:hypothetical protein